MKDKILNVAAILLLMISSVGALAQNKGNYIRFQNSQKSYSSPDFYVTHQTKIKTRLVFNSLNNSHCDLFGCYKTGTDNTKFYVLAGTSLRATYGERSVEIGVTPELGREYYIGLERGLFYLDLVPDASVHDYSKSFDAGDISNVKRIWIGGTGHPTDYVYNYTTSIEDVSFYDFRVFEDNTLMHNYIPSKYGDKFQFYDTRQDDFATNINNVTGEVHNGNDCEHRYVFVVQNGVHCKICNDEITFDKWAESRKEDFGLTAMDPYLDVQADSANAGRQVVFISSQSPMDRIQLVDSATNSIIQDLQLGKAESSISMPIPASDKARTLYAIAHITYGKMNGTVADTSIVNAPLKVYQKPYHVISAMEVVDSIAVDEKSKIATHIPCIRIALDNPDEEDVQSSDMFVLQRSDYADFRNSLNLSTFGFDDFANEDKKVAKRRWAYFKDDTENAQVSFNPNDSMSYSFMPAGIEESTNLSEMDKAILRGFYEYPDRRIYYRVVRATTMSIWSKHLAPESKSPYVRRSYAMTANLLPIVSSVSVQQTENWLQDKKVNVTIRLDNPLPWKFNSLLDSAKVVSEIGEKNIYRRYAWPENDKSRIIVQRYSPISEYYNGVDDAMKEYVIERGDIKWDSLENCYKTTITDCQALPYLHYYYRAVVDTAGSYYPVDKGNVFVPSSKEDADKCYSETAALIQSFSASQGEMKGKVFVEWEMGSGLSSVLKLKRRDIVDGTVKEINVNSNTSNYTDSIKPGHVYRYTLTSTTMYHGNKYEKTDSCLGWPSFYGTLKGRIQMHNGIGIAGAKVRIGRKKAIDIPDVYEEDRLILKGIHEGLIAEARPMGNVETKDVPLFDSIFVCNITTDDKGYFCLDSALYTAEGAQYDVSVIYGNCTFTYNDRVSASAQLTLSGKRCEYEDIIFTSNNDKTIKGRVLYDKSTVPVRDAYFELNGSPLHDSNGRQVFTDQSGNFTITLPNAKVDSLKVMKEGHTFKSGGYICDKDGNRSYQPADLNGLTIFDMTKVRLVGRITGGNRQGDKPLGFALSKNNLGDDLSMILQLEGDNTAQIVYMDAYPDSTEIDVNVHHPYQTLEQQIAEVTDSTKVSYQRKRIVVKPSAVTGEFFVDLFPTKYKVTQLCAEGYDNLYSVNEGFDILDLSDAVVPHDSIYHDADRGDKTYTYNATYKRIYHEPVTVTATEYVRGRAVEYLGAGSMTDKNLLGETVTVPLYENGQYTFGAPVFENGERYTMQVQAHEDYYYNGNGVLDKVYLEGGELLVRNGLADNQEDATYMLDSLGTTTIFVDANNATFSLTGEDALRQLHFSVKVNGYYYEAKPIKGYVTGVRYKGTDMIADTDLTVVDVLRDPPGSNGYAYLEQGTTYNWRNEDKLDFSIAPSVELSVGTSYSGVYGAFAGMGGGGFAGVSTSGGATLSTNVTFPILFYKDYEIGSYSLTLNDRIQTSSDPRDVGAMSDVYIGTVNTLEIGRVETISVLDEVTYGYCKAAIEKGQVRIISEGKDKNGKSYWLAISEKVTFSKGMPRAFAYSQKYIVGTLIPELYSIISEKLIYASKEEVQRLADSKNDVYYMSKVAPDDDDYASEGTYEAVFPAGHKAEDFKQDEVQKCISMITNWIIEIGLNEQIKLDARDTDSSKALKRHSIAGTTISHDESSDYYYDDFTKRATGFKDNASGWNWGLGTSGSGTPLGGKKDKGKGITGSGTDQDNKTKTVTVKAPGAALSITGDLGFSLSTSGEPTKEKHSTVKTGYEIGTNDGGYMNVDVYKAALASGGDLKHLGWISDAGNSDEAKPVSNYIFVTRGGAARNPWTAPDSTIAYNVGQPLGTQLLKIENPKIYIDKPVVNNQPGDEAATFTVRLSNETELTQGGVSGLKHSSLTLYVEDATNKNGAKISMDGEPLTSGRTFVMGIGETLEKTIEVKRGAKGYDYENIKLVFSDEYHTLADAATLSVHYVPTSTPLRLLAPTDKWVLNTLCEPDKDGYYMPVTISDFNIGYDNFDHIELQYKKQTEGESQWVTLCSWYCDTVAYNNGSGIKELFEKSATKLSYAFHGEKDPMEMKYDLRAVSFCRLGTGFVTRSSDVVSGTKDTRCPDVFGMPTPASGILTYEDVIQMNFTEPIAYNYLDETSNFKVQGYTNKTDISQSNTLYFPGNDGQLVTTEVTRNLNHRPFSVDMLVRTDEADKEMVFFSHGNQIENMAFGVTEDGRLFARISGETFKSAKLSDYTIDLTTALTHVGMIYRAEQQDVQFFASTGILEKANPSDHTTVSYTGNGVIHLGKDSYHQTMSPLKGKMLDVRLWGTELSDNQIATLGGKHLSGYEKELIGYWPMTETQGNIIADVAHGAYMTMSGGVSWDNVEGFSLKTIKNKVELDAEYMSTQKDNDNSLTFWFKVDEINESKEGSLLTFGSDMLPEKDNGRLFIGFKKGKMVLTTNGADYQLGLADSLANKGWHHFAMTVDRSKDQFAAYVDAELVAQEPASLIDGLASDYAAFGDTTMTAHFDVISQWDLALPSYVVYDTYNTRYTGREMGLHAYLPFTVYDTSEQGAMHADSCLLNAVYYKNDEGKEYMSSRRLITRGFDAKVNLDKEEHAPIREIPPLENLDFSWSSTGTGLQININTNDKVINKEQIFVTVRGVEDLCGNVMRNPRMMTYYVDKNVLRWLTKEINVECNEGYADTVQVTWENISGKRLSYIIENLPSWMTADVELGTVAPAQLKTVTFITDAGLAAGTYTRTINLTDEDGLSDPLTFNLTVKPTAPGWKVDKTKWDRTMNMRAMVETKGCNGSYVIDDNTGDVVAAFIENDCVGVSHITKEGNIPNLMMTIYGDKELSEGRLYAGLTFLLWNHETGAISELRYIDGSENEGTIYFKTNSVVGLPGDETYSKDGSPVILRASDKKEQSIHMTSGWNWISLNVMPEPVNGINSIFVNQSELFSNADIIKHVDFAQYDEELRDWFGSLTHLDYHHVFQCYVANEGNYRILGRQLPVDSMYVVVKGGASNTAVWNDLPYLLPKSMPVEDALTDFQIGTKAQHGDIVKGLDEFVVADAVNGKWVGTLKYMQPGKGYYIYHHGHDDVAVDTLRYYTGMINARANAPFSNATKAVSNMGKKAFSLPVIARLEDGLSLEEDEKLVAYVDGERVGVAKSIDVADSTLFFISVRGNAGDKVTFAIEKDGGVVSADAHPVTLTEYGVLGTLDKPHLITFGEDDVVDGEEGNVYDLSGRKVPGSIKSLRSGIYISNQKKILK